MIQNIIALTIVFVATGYTIYSIVKSLTAKKASHCGGCSGCSFKELPAVKHAKAIHSGSFQSQKFIFAKHGK